jgi:hypothetical protein
MRSPKSKRRAVCRFAQRGAALCGAPKDLLSRSSTGVEELGNGAADARHRRSA